ncbi:Hint domain-containing protein [Rhodobium gokarnense]|uniref:Hint domain-containing protein n=1 Tax=Rhodobium gokarnense TaxID=364296 RepID=A0ABT3HCK2_9HYPH|nr:Hint domain-containing protein [Rhodobium gokarnense]MCW2308095.1 hypothetical protein [Rhodobium gokarnense]
MTPFLNNFVRLYLLSAFFVFISSAIPHAQEQLTAQDIDDVRYIVELAKKRGASTGLLDFNDPVQYRFFRRRAILTGATPETAPQFFREMDATREAHMKKGGLSDEEALAGAADGTGEVAINQVSGFGTANDTVEDFSASLLSSTPGGSELTRLTVQLHDGAYDPIGPLAQNTEHAQGENTQVSTTGTFSTPTQPQDKRTVYTVGTYHYQPYGGAAQHGYIVNQSDTIPQTITTTNPAKHGGNVAGQIRVCLNRSGDDCDITEPSGGQQNVIFPVAGSITYYDEIQTPFDNNNSFSSVVITKQQSGGGCLMAASQNLLQLATVSTDKMTLSWNIDPASFGAACFNQADQLVYTLTVQVTVGTGNNAKPVFAYVTNATDAVADLNTAKILPIQFRWGCLAAGTEVLVRRDLDDTTVPIEEVRIGDLVQANPNGDLVKVIANTIGTEPIPMIRIHTDGDRSVLVTEGHPMVTSGGIKLARQLAEGDVLFGQKGEHLHVTGLEQEMYAGNVWSLDVASVSSDGTDLGSDGTTFFANGIQVGDVKLQNRYERLSRKDPRSVLERLPEKWHQDYFNYLRLHGGKE